MADKNPRWRRISALVVCALALGALIVWHARLKEDFLPLDRSFVGPNLLAAAVQWAILLILAVLVYPPWRRAAHRFLDRKFDTIHGKLDTLQQHHEAHKDRLSEHRDLLEVIGRSLKDLHDKHDELADSHQELRRKLDER